MPYFAVAIPETQLQIGDDVAIMNPLYSGGPPAYVDNGRRVRINSRALLARPRAVYDELCRIGAERWTRREVAAAVIDGAKYVRRALARSR
jgi:hypothetical protein